MSSPPSPRSLDGLIAEDFGEAALHRPDVMALFEPHRESVNYLMDSFEEETQSWRDYCGCIYGWSAREDGAIPHAAWGEARRLMAEGPDPCPPSPSGLACVRERPHLSGVCMGRGPDGGSETWWRADYLTAHAASREPMPLSADGIGPEDEARLDALIAEITGSTSLTAPELGALREQFADTRRMAAGVEPALVARLLATVDAARATASKLNRLWQQADGLIRRSGLLEGRERGGKGRSLGRALANYAAATAAMERDEARAALALATAENERLRSEVEAHRIGAALAAEQVERAVAEQEEFVTLRARLADLTGDQLRAAVERHAKEIAKIE